LSRLLFGRALNTLSAFQAAQLAGAVANLAGRGGEGIMAKLRRGFGLDDLDVTTAEDGTSSLTAGKYISRNTYTEIEVDQQGRSTINLNLDVTDNLTVRGSVSSDGQTGIGVFLEKDY
jgi:translocation and assembly module TamB